MGRRTRRGFGPALSAGAFEAGEEDVNPNSYITNLSDCMLVLAVGFIVALIVAWNVELPEYTVLDEADLTEIEDVESIEQAVNAAGSSYNKIGEVYQDPVTGKTYVLEQESEDESGSSGGESDNGGNGQ